MKTRLVRLALCASLAAPLTALAGADEAMVEAPVYDTELVQISIREGEILHQQGVRFYDVNTLEIWADGFVPGATFFNVGDWKKLLPKDKNAMLVFYCVNELCTSSELAAREVQKLGYTNVRQMYQGIWGWKRAGNKVERP